MAAPLPPPPLLILRVNHWNHSFSHLPKRRHFLLSRIVISIQEEILQPFNFTPIIIPLSFQLYFTQLVVSSYQPGTRQETICVSLFHQVLCFSQQNQCLKEILCLPRCLLGNEKGAKRHLNLLPSCSRNSKSDFLQSKPSCYFLPEIKTPCN